MDSVNCILGKTGWPDVSSKKKGSDISSPHRCEIATVQTAPTTLLYHASNLHYLRGKTNYLPSLNGEFIF